MACNLRASADRASAGKQQNENKEGIGLEIASGPQRIREMDWNRLFFFSLRKKRDDIATPFGVILFSLSFLLLLIVDVFF